MESEEGAVYGVRAGFDLVKLHIPLENLGALAAFITLLSLMETEMTPLLSDLLGYTGLTRRLIAHY
jgi:hypothetical protein